MQNLIRKALHRMTSLVFSEEFSTFCLTDFDSGVVACDVAGDLFTVFDSGEFEF